MDESGTFYNFIGVVFETPGAHSRSLVHRGSRGVLIRAAHLKFSKELDPVSRATGIPGWYWVLGIKCTDTMGVGLVY